MIATPYYRRRFFKHGEAYEDFLVLFENERFMLVQNTNTGKFSFGTSDCFGTLYGFPVCQSCLTMSEALKELNRFIEIDSEYPELREFERKHMGITILDVWNAMIGELKKLEIKEEQN